jgi:tetraprenyl-beta-curcumene synthase
VLAPRSQQGPVVQATVAFQAIYDYVDTLAEQPGACVAAAWQLHLALLRAVEPGQEHPDYYGAGGAGGDDGGYLHRLVEGCACALSTLPSWPAVTDAVLATAVGIASYQALNHGGSAASMARWAQGLTPPGSGLLWWETAAAAASSLTAFALVAAAAHAQLTDRRIAEIQTAYYPWIGALHVLLDSLADRSLDAATDQPSLIANYSGERQAAARMGGIAVQAVRAAGMLPDGRRHTILAAAMSSYYLSLPSVAAGPVGREVRRALRPLDAPTMAVLRTRQVVYRAVSRSPRESTRSPLQARPVGEETNPGNSRIMRAPPSGETSARTEPPCASAIARTIANPRPVPPEERLRAESVR